LRGNMTYASASGESYLYTHFNYPIIGTENNFMNSFDVGFSWTEGSFFAKQYRQLNWPFYSKNILDSTFSEVSLFPLGGFEYYYSAFRSE
jgi:hypothetical protein